MFRTLTSAKCCFQSAPPLVSIGIQHSCTKPSYFAAMMCMQPCCRCYCCCFGTGPVGWCRHPLPMCLHDLHCGQRRQPALCRLLPPLRLQSIKGSPQRISAHHGRRAGAQQRVDGADPPRCVAAAAAACRCGCCSCCCCCSCGNSSVST